MLYLVAASFYMNRFPPVALSERGVLISKWWTFKFITIIKNFGRCYKLISRLINGFFVSGVPLICPDALPNKISATPPNLFILLQ